MIEGSEELNKTLDEYLRLVVRRRWWLLLPMWVVALGTLVVALLLPGIYRSEAVLLVDAPVVPQHYVVPNVTSDLRSRLQTITQQILSRTRLLQIIEEFRLYAKEKESLVPEELVQRMRKSIEIQLVQNDPRRNDLNAFRISFSAENPQVAQQVNNRLTSLFIEENLKVREQQSRGTTMFLQAELDIAREELQKQEARLREFRTRYLGELPEQLGSNLQILSGLHMRYQNVTAALNRAREHRVYLESLFNQYRDLAEEGGPIPGSSAPLAQTVAKNNVASLRNTRAQLLARYTEKHPDVLKVEEEIVQAEALLAELTQQQKDAESENPEETEETSVSSRSPQMGKLPELQSQLRANQTEIDNLIAEEKRLEEAIQQSERRLNLTPLREQQLADIVRDYNLSKNHYENLLRKKMDSELATNLEKRQQGEQFRLVDPPSLPQKPFRPNRQRINLLGIALGFGLSVGLAFLVEVRDRSLHTEKELTRLFSAPVVVGVPEFFTPTEERQRRWRRLGEWVAGSLLLLTVLAGEVFLYWRG